MMRRQIPMRYAERIVNKTYLLRGREPHLVLKNPEVFQFRWGPLHPGRC
jgi:hypothetical protein